MISLLPSSCTLIGNLTIEADKIRNRCKSIITSIRNSNDDYLLFRLKSELNLLETRRAEISNIASTLKKNKYSDNLSIEFLSELCQRPIIYNRQ